MDVHLRAGEDLVLPNNEQALVAQCLAGNELAIRDLIQHFRGAVFGLCLRMLRHHQDAEDVTQETFVRAIRSLGTWQQDRQFRPWLMTIASNRCRSKLTARARRPVASEIVTQLPDRTPDDGSNLAEEVTLALGSLRDDYREAFLLFHEHQLSYAEIAERLKCPLGTVKTWVHRARRELVDTLRQRQVVEGRLR